MIHARNDYNRIQDPQNKIPLLEPVFLLRAKDSLSAATVRFWADELEKQGGDKDTVALARLHADKMDTWEQSKLPDCPAEEIRKSGLHRTTEQAQN